MCTGGGEDTHRLEGVDGCSPGESLAFRLPSSRPPSWSSSDLTSSTSSYRTQGERETSLSVTLVTQTCVCVACEVQSQWPSRSLGSWSGFRGRLNTARGQSLHDAHSIGLCALLDTLRKVRSPICFAIDAITEACGGEVSWKIFQMWMWNFECRLKNRRWDIKRTDISVPIDIRHHSPT